MELNELQNNWKVFNSELDSRIKLNIELIRKMNLNKSRSNLQKMKALCLTGLVINVIIAFLLGDFIINHIYQPEFTVPAILLDLLALLLVKSGIGQLRLIGQISYTEPVIHIQKKLEELRIHKIRYTKNILLAGPLLWVPALIVFSKGSLNINVYSHFDPWWIAANVLFGIAVIPAGYWLIKKLPDTLSASSFLNRLKDDIAGQSLTSAMRFIDEIKSFEKQM